MYSDTFLPLQKLSLKTKHEENSKSINELLKKIDSDNRQTGTPMFNNDISDCGTAPLFMTF